MAAYAALVSLMSVLEGVLHPTRLWILLDRKQIQSLQQKVCSLQDFLEDFSSKLKTDGLESEITAASYSAEDIIESFVLDQILAQSEDRSEESLTRFSQDIQEVIEKMDSIETKVFQIEEKMGVIRDKQRVKSVSAAGLSRSAPRRESTMVGFEDHLMNMIERLIAPQSELQSISIVGMAGIGKTTLAKNIYDHKVIKEHFDIRAWVPIAQEHTVREILLALLHDVDKEKKYLAVDVKKQESKISDEHLGEQLHKALFGWRYLIVIDDMWTTEVWNEIRRFIPDLPNGSRIIITTRLKRLATCFDSYEEIDVLDDDKSWYLFCEKVFPQENCPPEFEEMGKKILKCCRGLPLAIVVIGGLLAKSNKSLEHWEYVAEILNSVTSSGSDDHFLKILSLGYSHLPIHLKPCFLYVAIFPEDCEIRVSRLIKLWVAEGFLKPIRDKSLEDIANEYLKDLIERNLIQVAKRGTTGKMKSCIVHDLLRELCLMEARKENFLCVTSVERLDIPPNIESKRRLCILRSTRNHPKVILNALLSPSLARTVVGEVSWISPPLASSSRLLRVLDVVDKCSPEEIMQLVNSRYLAFVPNWDLDPGLTSSISLLWNLQTLIAHPSQLILPTSLPSEIWEMPQLRHIEFNDLFLPDPPHPQITGRNSYILENLQTIFTILNFRCNKEICKRIPNLRKMKIEYWEISSGAEWAYYCLNDLVHLDKLESLTCRTYNCNKMSAGNIAFPISLKKLHLSGCCLPWKDMTVVGSLPSLEVLKLEWYAFEGPEWNPIEGEFVRLKFLLIGRTDLMYWRAYSTHFPRLERLVLQYSELKEIPSDFAGSPMLQFIQLTSCNSSVVSSAKQILKNCERLGHEDLQVEVHTENGAVFILASEDPYEAISVHSYDVASESNSSYSKEKKMSNGPGDWNCRSCQHLNFQRRDLCQRCGEPKPGDDGSGRSGWKSGDWICPRSGCNEHNFASRMECFRCNAPRESSGKSSV